MTGKDNYTIQITTDPAAFREGALMMSVTEPWITLEIPYDSCLTAFEGPYKEVYVLKQNAQMTGFVILQVCGTFNGYIQTICIKEALRGKGLGKKLLHFCEERIHKTSPNIFICVSAFNEGAIKLYYEFGFTLVGTLRNFVKDGFDELLLRKTIGPRQGYKAGQ
jgi:ribosomal-protein-alanine N-acetyltransferase